jgi:hypothetical protein
MYQEGPVVVGVIPEGMAVSGGVVKPLRRRYEEIVRREEVVAHVAVVETDDSMGWDVLDEAQKGAERGVEHGLQRWAIVAEGVKQFAMRNRIDLPELEVYATEDREAAMAWARGDRPEAETF